MDKEKIDKMQTLSADKGYDGERIIETIKDYGIKPIIDIKNHWKDGEKTGQYKNTNIVYTYNGDVFYVNEFGKEIPMKYVGYDKVKDTLRYQYDGKIYNIELSADERIFTPVARNSKKYIIKERH